MIAVGLRNDLRQIDFDPEIIVLNLHGNYLSSLRGLPVLHHLTELNLSSNRFVSCELPELAFMSCLKALDLSGNRIDSLYYLPFLPGLKVLSVCFNQIRSLAGLSENTPDLVDLDIRGNLVENVASIQELVELKSLQRLWIGGRQPNPICVGGKEGIEGLCKLFASCEMLESIDGKDEQEWRDSLETQNRRIGGRNNSSTSRQDSSHDDLDQNRDQSIDDDGEVDPMRELSTPTPRFDQLSRRFKSHVAVARASLESELLSLDPVMEEGSENPCSGSSVPVPKEESNSDASSFFRDDSLEISTVDMVISARNGITEAPELRVSTQFLPEPTQAPTRPAPAKIAKKDNIGSPNPWGDESEEQGNRLVAAVAASMAINDEDEDDVVNVGTNTSCRSVEAPEGEGTSTVATNTSPRRKAVTCTPDDSNEDGNGDEPDVEAIQVEPSAPEPQNRDAALLLEQHVLLEAAYATAETLRAQQEESHEAHEQQIKEMASSIKQIEASKNQEKYKTEAALKRVFSAETTMMSLRKELEERSQELKESQSETFDLKMRLKLVEEEKNARQTTTGELTALFERQKQIVAALKADNDTLKQRLSIDKQDMEDKFAGEMHQWKMRVEQYQRQLQSVESEDSAREQAWERAQAEFESAMSREQELSDTLSRKLEDQTALREKMERRFLQLQQAFETATDQLQSQKEQISQIQAAAAAAAAAAVAQPPQIPAQSDTNFDEKSDSRASTLRENALQTGNEACKDTIEELCGCVKSLRSALATAESERENEHKAASRLYTQMTHARDEIHRLRRLAGVKDEAGSTFRAGGMRLVTESLNSLDTDNTGHAGHQDHNLSQLPSCDYPDDSDITKEASRRENFLNEDEDDVNATGDSHSVTGIDRSIRESLQVETLLEEQERLNKRVYELEAVLSEKKELSERAQELVTLLSRKEEDLSVTLRVKEAMLVDQGASIADLKTKLADSEARCGDIEFVVRGLEAQLDRARDQQEKQDSELRRQRDVESRLKGMIASYHDEVASLRQSGDDTLNQSTTLAESMDSVSNSEVWSSPGRDSSDDSL
jgi:chromosome segregation ATPase